MAAEIGSTVVATAASEAIESGYETIRRQISYVLEYKRIAKEFRDNLGDLRNRRERVEHSVERARTQGEEIEKDVEDWLNKVKELEESTVQDIEKSIVQNEDEAKCCFKGLGCGTLFERYTLSKKAKEAAERVKAFLDKSNFETVSYRPRLQKTKSMYVRGYQTFDSRQSKIQAITEALKDPDVNVIGVYGMGGVGKTTLVKKVAWLAMEDKLFDEVIVAEVTDTPDYKKVQERIACELGMEFNNETEFERRGRIRDKLKKEKGRVLIILDNIWQSVDLEKLGIPFGAYDESKGANLIEYDEKESAMHTIGPQYRKDDQRRCKVVLTSRDLKILEQDMNTEMNFKIEVLWDEEANNLFGKIVGDLPKDPDYQSIADKIISKCGGLPLAIETMAKALKKREPSVWEVTLDQLEASTSRLDDAEKLYSLLKLSYEFLRSEDARSLFLLCSLHNAGNEIYIYDLLRLGVGIGLFKDVSKFKQKRNRVFKLIGELKASNLLMECDTKDWVKMHDIMHRVAVWIASEEKNMRHIPDATRLKQQLEDGIPKEAIAISVPFKEIDGLSEILEFPKLQLFLLFMKNRSLPIPSRFFEKTTQLQVLGFKGIDFSSPPSSFHCLTNLRTLSLEDCLLGDIAMIAELKKLEILSFSGSDLEKLPGEIGLLTRLKLLDLSNCPNLMVIIPKVISSLSQLEELYLSDSFVHWEAIGLDNQAQSNASLIKLSLLSHLTALDIHVPDAQIVPRELNFKELEGYKIFIGDVWNWSGTYEYSRTLKLKRLINTPISSGDVISTLLRRAEELHLDELNGFQNVLYSLDCDGFPQLKHLRVQNGSEFSYIIRSEGSTPHDVFPELESLYLHNLIELEKICDCPITAISFHKLRIIEVEKCDRLKSLFSFSLAKNLLELQNIEVTDCKNLIGIFGEASEDQVTQNERNSEIVFKKLRSLTLQYLPQLEGFGFDMESSSRSQTLSKANMKSREISSEDEPCDSTALLSQKVVFPCLEDLNLTLINVEKIWLNHVPAMSSYYTQTLKSITVEECNGLKFLFPSSMVQSLVLLQDLVVRCCKSMEGIIDAEEVGEEKMIFPKLSNLALKSLPKLTRFGIGYLVEFPSLKDLQIENCGNLKIFFSNSSCPEMMIKETEEMNSENCAEDILHSLFDEKVAFPILEKMKLTQMDNMQLIWHNQLHANSFCKLKQVIVRDCEKLVTLIRPDTQGLLAFQNLEELSISSCWRMKSLFPTSIATSLQQLQIFLIVSCGLEEIVAKEEVQEAPRFVFPRLALLRLFDLRELKCFYVGFHTTEWPMLKLLHVCLCPKVRAFGSELFSLQKSYEESQPENPVQQPLFLLEKVSFNLERLSLSRDEITLISRGGFPADIFGKLKTLLVFDCMDVSAIFLLDFLQRFYNLENLYLLFNNFKELFPFEGLNVDERKHDVGPMRIRNLLLYSLPDLEHTWKLDSPVDPFLQNLETLDVRRCNRLTSLMPSSASLKNLTTLRVIQCDRLTNILLSTAAKSLVQLKAMRIGECNLVTEILAYEEGSTDDEIVFEQLKSLKLYRLDSLACFSSGNHAFKFPRLEEVIVTQCPKLKIFSQSVLSTPMLKKVQLTQDKDDKYEWKNDLNSTIQQMSTDMVGFHNLKYLKVSEFSHLKEKWNHQLPVSTVNDLKSLVVDELPDITSAIPSHLLWYFKKLKALEVRSCDSLKQVFDLEGLLNADRHKLSRSPQKNLGFQNLRSLLVDNCNSLRYIFTPFLISSLVQLQKINIRNCAMLEEIITKEEENDAAIDKINLKSITLEALPNLTSFYSGSKILKCPPLEKVYAEIHPLFDKKDSFPILKELRLKWNKNMKELWHGEFSEHVCKLKVLELIEFPLEASIFPSSLFHTSCNLEDLVVSNSFFEEIFLCRGVDCEERHSEALTKLRDLKLSKLPKLLHLWKENSQRCKAFQNLINLEVSECGKLENLVPSCVSFQNLVSLEVCRCRRLKTLVTLSTAKSLVKLAKMKIISCKMVEEIIGHVEEEVEDQILFSRLKFLELQLLPGLTSFCWGNFTLEFPSLEQVIVKQCPNMKIFSQGVLSTPKLQRVQLTEAEDDGCWEGNLNSTIQNLSKEVGDGCWEGDLNSTMQKLFKEVDEQTSIED